MERSRITFIINGNTYSLGVDDVAAIGSIPAADRQQLLALLEAVREQEKRAAEIARTAVLKLHSPPSALPAGDRPVVAERMGRGDVDALMARLIMEENRSKKPLPTRQGMYKWIVISVVAAILVIAFF